MSSFCIAMAEAQNDTTASLTFSGYAEVYYCYDMGKPMYHKRPEFLYNHKRHNQVSLNLAYLKAAFASQKTRANLALMVGNYAQYNLAAEPTWAQFVYEANVGVKLSKKQNLWLDAGIMPSHIGFESAVGADCWTLTRSLVAENSPYYEAGIKLSFLNKKENLTVAALLLNGWQRIQSDDSFDKLAFGLQLNYKPSEQLTLNYSNFFGYENPDDQSQLRTYQNFYAIWDGNFGLGITAGFDFGKEEDRGDWYSPVFILKWQFSDKWRITNRYEYISDPNQVVAKSGMEGGVDVLGISLGYDYFISEQSMLRIEARQLQAKEEIFRKSGDAQKGNLALTGSLCVKF